MDWLGLIGHTKREYSNTTTARHEMSSRHFEIMAGIDHQLHRLAVSFTNNGVLSCNRKTLCSIDQSSLFPCANSISKCQSTLHRIRFISAHARLFIVTVSNALCQNDRSEGENRDDNLRFSQTIPRSNHKRLLSFFAIAIKFWICIWQPAFRDICVGFHEIDRGAGHCFPRYAHACLEIC